MFYVFLWNKLEICLFENCWCIRGSFEYGFFNFFFFVWVVKFIKLVFVDVLLLVCINFFLIDVIV